MPMSGCPMSVSPSRVVRHLGPQLLGVARRVDAGRRRCGEQVCGVLVGRPRPLAQPRHGEGAGRGRGPPGRGVGRVWAVGHSGNLKVRTSVLCRCVSCFKSPEAFFGTRGCSTCSWSRLWLWAGVLVTRTLRSFLRNLARRFWNQTWSILKLKINSILYEIMSLQLWIKY